MDKLRRVAARVRVQDGDGLLSQGDMQDGDQQLVAREGQGDVHQDGQQGDGVVLSTQCQGNVRQDDGDIV